MPHIVAPSILASDFGNLSKEIEMINSSAADWVHCDIMDGRFVPNISFGIPVLKAVQRVAKKPMDVHLMIEEPERYLQDFRDAGATILSVHLEATVHLHRVLQEIKDLGMRAGVAINPSTPVESLQEILPMADLICLMSVNPGFGGQSFIESTYDKLRRLVMLREETGSQALIEIDGGVTTENAGRLLAHGADVLVAGSFVFKAQKPEKTIASLKHQESGKSPV